MRLCANTESYKPLCRLVSPYEKTTTILGLEGQHEVDPTIALYGCLHLLDWMLTLRQMPSAQEVLACIGYNAGYLQNLTNTTNIRVLNRAYTPQIQRSYLQDAVAVLNKMQVFYEHRTKLTIPNQEGYAQRPLMPNTVATVLRVLNAMRDCHEDPSGWLITEGCLTSAYQTIMHDIHQVTTKNGNIAFDGTCTKSDEAQLSPSALEELFDRNALLMCRTLERPDASFTWLHRLVMLVKVEVALTMRLHYAWEYSADMKTPYSPYLISNQFVETVQNSGCYSKALTAIREWGRCVPEIAIVVKDITTPCPIDNKGKLPVWNRTIAMLMGRYLVECAACCN